MMSTGCISDTDCGICDPDKLVLESISGVNYANTKVHRLTDGVSSGKYFIEDIVDCPETEEAQESDRGAEEYCKISPLVAWSGLEFVFNNLLDATSVELVRKDPSSPQLFEVYDWRSQIAHIEGPITRYNGDYLAESGDDPDEVNRLINLTCVENLRAQGTDFNHEVLDDDPLICNGFQDVGGETLPLRMQAEGITKSYTGETDWRTASCAAPDEGPDTCCTVCDYELSVNVAKYGVDANGSKLTPVNALTCDPSGNIYEECAGFVTDVNRDMEPLRYLYDFGGEIIERRLPLADKVRETHPDLRPAGIEPDGLPCQSNSDCEGSTGIGDDPGAVCIGTNAEGNSCDADTAGCMDLHCKSEWFVTCNAEDNLGGGGYCVDKRFKDKGAGACYRATAPFLSCDPEDGSCVEWGAGDRLAQCDAGENPNGTLTAEECCQESLGSTDGGPCDPLFQPNVTPIGRFDRDRTLPEETRSCYCGDPAGQADYCADQIEQFCTAPWGNLTRHDGTSNEDAYITRFVTKAGGVVYDPALKGVLYLPADRGNQTRALVEECADTASSPNLIGGLNVQDGWRMHDGRFNETYENFDRGMCSGSEYRVVFSSEGQRLRDKVGNYLADDKLSYVFETPEFHVIPGTGFPTDNLRIGACDDFEIQLSNKYDLSPENTQKIALVQIGRKAGGEDSVGESCETSMLPECWEEQHVVAGGPNCTTDPLEVDESTPPCMEVDVSEQRQGEVRVVVDSVRFGTQLVSTDTEFDSLGREATGRYRFRVPGLEDVERFEDLDLSNPEDLAKYNAAFHDVCGMPLITSGGQGYTDFYYDFNIDPPKCKEDTDGDGVQLSCDNARDFYNPYQEDQDLDGFGDVMDLCPLTSGSSNTSDSDKDGVGNNCDTCRQTSDKYNLESAMVDDPRLWVRNIPSQADFDQDGIGDVCDNCIVDANCGVFGPENPHSVGVETEWENSSVCQQDANSDMIGDSCVNPDDPDGKFFEHAAGPVGFAPEDDFDQDGLANVDDFCPRQPVSATPTACTDDTECGDGSTCADSGYCNHVDSDGDQVGDICDTCPFDANPMQVTDGGMQVDDEDGDFVGASCETNSACEDLKDPRPFAFMEVSVNGLCCVNAYPGDGQYVMGEDGSWDCEGLCDPDGFPVQIDCADEAEIGEDVPDGSKCRSLPNAVASEPGIVDLPPGCEDALADAGLCAPQGEDDPNCTPDMANQRLGLTDIDDPDELWGKMCFLPQWDQDFDGIGDACDLCPFNYDPFNETYVDENTGKRWDNVGKYCAGVYAPDAVCAAEEEEESTDTGTDTGDTTDG
ncbi:thrombospondin type 3 repeat-containing protein [Pseudenhygromyxa sp. WMMC2535]|nr:thrombospondin type 3 repeat-containing protein [Pseudenhygromyxa sp. WMMC2535]